MVKAFERLEESTNRIKLSAETKIQEAQQSKNHNLFQVFFLMNDDAQSVEVMETPKIDLEEVTAHLKLDGSIFITHKGWSEV